MTYKRVVDVKAQGYSKEQCDEMLEKLQQAKVFEKKGQAINFFIRGHYVYESREHLLEMFKKVSETNPATFTLYTDEQYWIGEHAMKNPVTPENITELRETIEFLGPENVYLQVSDEIRQELDLRALSNPRATPNNAPMRVLMNSISLIPLIAVTFVGIFGFEINE